MTLRTTVYLDENILGQMRRFIPQRGLSQLINDLLQQKVAELEKAEIEAQMREGYLNSRQDRSTLNAEWQAIDGEGWPQ
jgi:metal-responsive CopG/Arc/MetJ family transcriptional regulator